MTTQFQDNEIILGDCVEVLRQIEPSSIDAVITDPPYGLSNHKYKDIFNVLKEWISGNDSLVPDKKGFMGKEWDAFVPPPAVWKEVYRVMKPGAYLLCFAGTRTVDLMGISLRLARFEIRDMIGWVYGCVSEDTEILTENGFKFLKDIKSNEKICVYDKNLNVFSYEIPEKWNVYQAENEDCYHIYSNETNQIVSRNHRCLIERDNKLIFEYAENLHKYEKFPILTSINNVLSLFDGISVLAKVKKIKYTGIIFCPTVSTGAFVARRNGKIFITGNSGFPKSLNIGKKIDEIQGYEREITGFDRRFGRCYSGIYQMNVMNVNNPPKMEFPRKDKPISRDAKEWDGWGTALKPAIEPIILARKPIEKGLNVAKNVLEYGTGGLNIDEGRIKYLSEQDKNVGGRNKPTTSKKLMYGRQTYFESKIRAEHSPAHNLGRFPANLILDGSEEVESLFPATQPSRKTIKPDNRINKGNSMFIDRIHTPENSYNDSGSASRFFYHAEFTEEDYQPIFYCAKASKKEREMGCERLNGSLGLNFGGKLSGAGKPVNIGIRHNIHPTVKPIKLIEYLIKLTTKENQLVLDPFIGSGTTAIACRNLNRRCLGIEKNKGYYIIAKQRLTAEKEGDIFIEGK